MRILLTLIATITLLTPTLASEWMGSFYGVPYGAVGPLDGDSTFKMSHGKVKGTITAIRRSADGTFLGVGSTRFTGTYRNKSGLLKGQTNFGGRFDALRHNGHIVGEFHHGGSFSANKVKGKH